MKKLPTPEFKKSMILEKKIRKKPKLIEFPKKESNINPVAPIAPVYSKKLPDNIDEYFTKIEGSKEAFHSRELFKAEKKDVDIKTDLLWKEIVLINKLIFNNSCLKEAGLVPVFEDFIYNYMRLKISLDRKSRGEFVSINRGDKTEEATQLLSNLSNITGAKK